MSDSEARSGGRLILVATPIGNVGDLSERAVAALREADLVACEDTRHTGALLARLGVKARMMSLHEHNERRRTPEILDRLAGGERVALVSDAGTPLLSDPGFVLVREAVAAGHRVEAVPGPSAVLAGLVVSGLPPHPFTFAGFPPPKSGRRRRFFENFRDLPHTVVYYESPHRILASLDDLREICGEREIAVGRELTKLHEEVLRGPVSNVHRALSERDSIKGEFVVVVGRSPQA